LPYLDYGHFLGGHFDPRQGFGRSSSKTMKPFTLSYIFAKFGLNKRKDVQEREVFHFLGGQIFSVILPYF
jgi:hypothetical protein